MDAALRGAAVVYGAMEASTPLHQFAATSRNVTRSEHHKLVHQLRCVLRESKSNEDIVLLPLLLEAAAHKPGSFTELGAFDGITGSQTWLLEKCFGWGGVLIEASPRNYDLLNQTHRSRRSPKVHAAVCNGPGIDGKGELEVMGGGGTVAGVASDMAKGFSHQWRNAHRDCGNFTCSSKVPCWPLPTIIANHGYPHVTFLSLDVEGGEARVLQTTPHSLAAFPFDVVMVEADRHSQAKNAAVDRMLNQTGLVRRRLQYSPGSTNWLYVRPGIRDKRPNATEELGLRKLLTPAHSERLKHRIGKWPMSDWISRLYHGSANLLIDRLLMGLTAQVAAVIHASSEDMLAEAAAAAAKGLDAPKV